jgi:hypothetical protein
MVPQSAQRTNASQYALKKLLYHFLVVNLPRVVMQTEPKSQPQVSNELWVVRLLILWINLL